MRKMRLSRKLAARMMGGLLGGLILMLSALPVQAEEGKEPFVSLLEVAVSTDGKGIVARCSYKNYTDQSGCIMSLYLYQMVDGKEYIVADKNLSYADQGKESTDALQVEEGVYMASVSLQYSSEMKQINSQNYYKIIKNGADYEVEVMPGSGGAGTGNEADPTWDIGKQQTCNHDCGRDYTTVEPATPIRDELQAFQCIKCGAVLDYIEIPNSAYAAFLDETVKCIRETEAGGEAVISTDRWISFNRSVFETMKERPDVTVRVFYRHQGMERELVIPAGADIDKLMDENGYGGFLKIKILTCETK